MRKAERQEFPLKSVICNHSISENPLSLYRMAPHPLRLLQLLFLILTQISADRTAKTYIIRVDSSSKPSVFQTHYDWYTAQFTEPTNILHVYDTVFHGFSAVLTPFQAASVLQHPSVLAAFKDRRRHLHTTRSPQFLGLRNQRGLWWESNNGSDVIIGVFDTGIWPERRSFSDRNLGPVPKRWRGTCQTGVKFSLNNCNRKIVGARFFSKGHEAAASGFGGHVIGGINETIEFKSPRDADGHGTHTASTAAGRYAYRASMEGYASGIAKGVAPKARLAVYKVCWKNAGCFDSDILAAFDAAVNDGVDVISISVEGSDGISSPYYLDPIAIGAYGAASRGIFVSSLARNDGPNGMSVTNLAPWLTSVGAGLLSSKDDAALQTSIILRELIDHHIDGTRFLTIESQEKEDKATHSSKFKAVQTTCTTFYNLLSASSQIPSEPFSSIVAFLFLKLGKISDIFMKPILLKLADLMNTTSASASEIKHLEDCIGSVAAMGPEKLLSLLLISLSTEDFSRSNIGLIPILKKNTVGSLLQFFVEHIVPLAESFEKGSLKDLQAYAHGCWGLLPSFFRHQPSDTYQSFASLAKLLIPFLKKDSFMLENIVIGLQELVNESKSALASDRGSVQAKVQSTGIVNKFATDRETRCVYSREMASKNIKALALSAKELLQSLTNVLFEITPEAHKHLKGAMGRLVSIYDASVPKQIFIASLEKFQLLDDIGEHGKLESDTDGSAIEKESRGTDAKRSLIVDLASCIVEGSDDDAVNLPFCVIKIVLQATFSQMEAYQTLSRILENLHGKTSSKEAGNKDTRPELYDLSAKGQQKMKRKESAFSSKQEGYARRWKNKRDKKQNVGKLLERVGHSDHVVDLKKGTSNKPRDFKMKLSGGKKHNIPAVASSKTSKHENKKAARKRGTDA